jgi:hypothetical protein
MRRHVRSIVSHDVFQTNRFVSVAVVYIGVSGAPRFALAFKRRAVTERALFRKLIALADPLVDIEMSTFQNMSIVVVNLTLTIEFSNQQPRSYQKFKSQHLELFQSIEFTSNWIELEIESKSNMTMMKSAALTLSINIIMTSLCFISLISQ